MAIKQEDFIHKNIVSELVKEGYSEPSANHGAINGVDYYRRSSQAHTSKGIFFDYLYHARLAANLYKKSYEKGARR